MKHGGGQHPYGILALAARAALRFAARRNAPTRHDAWRPVALFWRQKRKGPEGARAGRVALAAGAVWLPQFHLHFMTRVNDRPRRDSMPGLSHVAAIHQRQVVMDHQRTIVQSGMNAAQPRRAHHPVSVFSLRRARSDAGTNGQAAAPSANSARWLSVPPTATWVAGRAQRPNLGRTPPSVRLSTKFQAAAPSANSTRRPNVAPISAQAADRAQRPNLGRTHPSVRLGAKDLAVFPYADSARRLIVTPTTAWAADRAQRPVRGFSLRHARGDSGAKDLAAEPYSDSSRQPSVSPTATWVAGRAQRPNLGRTYPSSRPGTRKDEQAQTFQTPRTYKHEPHLFRSRSVATGSAVAPRSQEGTDSPSNFSRPLELVWRPARQSAAEITANERQPDPRELARQAQGRSFPGQEAAPGMPHPSGHAPAPPAMKIDSGLMDRLADDVIRRMEQRARINRERRGL